jgi:hypothetical protein
MMFSNFAFVRKARRSADAWRTLGFIANESVYFSNKERNELGADLKSHRKHLILDKILESFKAAQRPGALRNFNITLGRITRAVDLYLPLQFIIGDVEEGDQLCSRYSYRLHACPRICRTCDVPTIHCTRTDIQCTRICVADIRELYETQDLDALRALAQRPTFNCLYDIDCGNDPYGVFSMIHTEGLHALEVGLMERMVSVLFADLPNKEHGALDRLVKKLSSHPRQHGYQCFPRLVWTDGVSKLSQLTGDQRVGKMFAILLVALTREGEVFFTKYLPGGHRTWERLVYCFQQMLCYWAWLKQDLFWVTTDEQACAEATRCIKVMMGQIQRLWPRQWGLKWLLTKLHEQFHVPRDIHRHGRHMNVHTGPQEHNHIQIKKASKKTQMRRDRIDLQTGGRIVDRLILQRAFDRVDQTVIKMDEALLKQQKELEREANDPNGVRDYDLSTADGLVHNATKGYVYMSQDITEMTSRQKRQKQTVMAGIGWKRSRRGVALDAKIMLQDDVLAFLVERFFEANSTTKVTDDGTTEKHCKLRCYTEYQRDDTVYRCHPKYRGERAYYDWCYIKWWDGDDPVTHEPREARIIGRIHLFVKTPDGLIKAVVHSVDHETHETHSVFGTYWHMEEDGPQKARKPKFELADVDALDDHVMVLPYNDTGKMYIHIHNRSEWPGYFVETRPPTEDYNEYMEEESFDEDKDDDDDSF